MQQSAERGRTTALGEDGQQAGGQALGPFQVILALSVPSSVTGTQQWLNQYSSIKE